LPGTLLCAGLVCIVSAYFGMQAAYPFVSAAGRREERAIWEARIKRDLAQVQRIEREIAALKTREGAITAARKLGWVLPNERPLRVPER
jgi:hypothetical protein